MSADTLRERFRQEMVVRGFSDRTQRSYLNAVTLLVRRTGTDPRQLSSDDLRRYFASLVTDHQVAPSTFRVHLTAVNRFYRFVLGEDKEFFVEARPKKRKKLRDVMSVKQTRGLISAIRVERYHAAAAVVYGCGLRCEELLSLSVPWIDSEALALHVHDGKGGVDRVVPLPRRTLELLREHWRCSRPSGELLFESPHRAHKGTAMSANGLRKALRLAAADAGIKQRVSIHSLRHAYASHLLECGVSLPLIQRWLGHASIQTTMIYAQVTKMSEQRAVEVLSELMEPL